MKVGRHCVVCGETNKENVNTLFSFPKSPTKQQKWKDILGITGKLKATARVCQCHFSKSQFVRDRLKKEATPQLGSGSGNIRSARNHATVPKQLVKIFPRPISSTLSALPVYNFQQVPTSSSFMAPYSTTASASDKAVQTESKISDDRKTVYRLNRRIKLLETKQIDVMAQLEKIFSKNTQFLEILKHQISRHANKKTAYSSFEKSTAISIYYSCGPQGYRTLLQLGLKIPSLRTISRWMKSFTFDTGINNSLLASMQNIVNDMSPQQKECIVVWDEMSIKEFIEYNHFSDKLEGIVDLGHLGRELDSATEVLVFMVQGIHAKWKFPLSFYFSNHNTKAEYLEKLIMHNITQMQIIGLNVKVGICDMSFTNQSVYKAWGITPNQPYRLINDKKIYFIHDTPHLIKLIRNNLVKHNFIITKGKGKHAKREKIRWLHVLSFYSKDRRQTSRMAPKLTNAHVYLKDYSKMRVKLAVQVLSHSVYAGMKAMAALKILKLEVSATAEFIKKVNDMFDFLNISKYEKDKPSRCAKNMFENPYIIDEYINFVKSIEVEKSTKRFDFLRGLEITLSGIKGLWDDLKQEGHKFIYTRQLQQDCLENFFACIRMKGGFCRNPTARQFKNNFRYLFFARLIKNPTSGNTECRNKRLVTGLANLQKAMLQSAVVNNDFPETEPQLTSGNAVKSPKFFGLKSKRRLKLGEEQNSCVANYFGGACVLHINDQTNCTKCANLISHEKGVGQANDILVDLKKYDGDSQLVYLNSNVEKVFVHLSEQFEKTVIESLQSNGCSVSEAIFHNYESMPKIKEWLNNECKLHRTEMIKYFIRVKLFRLTKDKNERIKQLKSWKQTRRDLRNQ